MKRAVILGIALVLAAALAGCGGDENLGPNTTIKDILSLGGTNDGDITYTGGSYSVFTSDQSPFTIHVQKDASVETRGFLTFSLSGIPSNATIVRATVLLPILSAVPAGTNPSVALLPDMVSFPPLDTLATQTDMGNVYNTTPILLGPSFEVFPGDAGFDASFDATDAVKRANQIPLSTLQIRLTAVSGSLDIDDLFNSTTGGGTPLLRVEYF